MPLFPLCVMRGSQIKPPSVQEAMKQVKDAQDDLIKAQATLDAATKMIQDHQEFVEQVADKIEGSDNIELLTLVKSLQDRIVDLENQERVALGDKKDAKKEISQGMQILERAGRQLACGGVAGAVARTAVAPIDRVKILMQTQFVSLEGGPPKYTSVAQTLRTIFQEEGFQKLWRGNTTNVVRVAPYAATQFTSYDFYKNYFFEEADITPVQRLGVGALAGLTATSLTHPLDVVRLRLNVQPELTGARDALGQVWAEGGVRSLFKGYGPTVISLSSFIAINFTTFDLLKQKYRASVNPEITTMSTLGLGACAGIVAQSICFPLDTIRRRMQMKGKTYSSTLNAVTTIFKKEGPTGFYKGMAPNVIKVVPNNAIRFVVYEFMKKQMGLGDNKRK